MAVWRAVVLGVSVAGSAAVVAPGEVHAAVTAPQLHVSGARLLDDSGALVRLAGVDRSGTEYACVQGWGLFDGPSDAASVQAMAAWGVNAVRVPLNEDCWLGINGVAAAYSGAAYRNAIQQYVGLLHDAGMVAILDLHWTAAGGALATGQQAMPDADHAPQFWTGVAQTFGTDRATVFDLFNEPYPDGNQDTTAAWTCWRDGGVACPGLGFTAAGMQSLVTAVRAAGATNVLMLGGVQYSNALDRWAAFAPVDPLRQLAVSFHMYGGTGCATTACWNTTVAPLAATVPVVTGEFGASYLGTDCGTTLVDQYMSWADQHGVSYLAWTWDTWGGCGVVVSDYAGTPASFGAAVKAHYAALVASPQAGATRHCLALSVGGPGCQDTGALTTPAAGSPAKPMTVDAPPAVPSGGVVMPSPPLARSSTSVLPSSRLIPIVLV